ncbi:MAG: hypothetical protein CVV42_19070 [Candidatus Riflebacteria bacterium HGW-Riflebacteria-2]|jgi:hypothetical protein|nr:MAG: hypothetical protein CVV42_19070 [Candidatus Riflebacteria bacterium HGW-Riflebacteria-2]
MKNSFRILLCFVFCLLQVAATAKPLQLTSFEELMSSLRRGYKVRAIIHYADCKLVLDGKESKAPDAIGGMDINVFEYFARKSIRNDVAFIAFSHTSMINLKGYIYNYVKFKIYEDGRVEVTAQYAKTISYRKIMDETFYTTINDRSGKGALYLFCEM